ncbi:MAG: hypothetical protein AUG51_17365 [Acidobacteria bacterium 13_1_20CM_3_53_8]|nr:MAG: hypothetical protein AUG51_17365 [Acidobacteria bacterium 13_1_20CM_3_53_8]
MKYSRRSIKIVAVMLVCILTALAQVPGNLKHFDNSGLSFDYPNGWTLDDHSSSDAQQLTLSRNDSVAQITLFAHRGTVDTPEKVAQAKTKLIDPYIAYMSRQFEQMGAHPTQSPATLEIGGAQAEGVHIRAVLENEPGEAGIYWLVLNKRLVVLTIFGPDQAIKQVASAWDTVRNSIRIVGNIPAPRPSPSLQPSPSPSPR